MNIRESLDELKDKLQELIEERKKAEEAFDKFLTLSNEEHTLFWVPDELSPQIPEIKDDLHRRYDLLRNGLRFVEKEDRNFWKDVARNIAQYLEPMVVEQREFNASVAHLMNELLPALSQSLKQIRKFQSALMHFVVTIQPLIDTMSRESDGVHEKLQVERLVVFSDTVQQELDLMWQQLDSRIETLQADSIEYRKALDSLQISLRSLHHLANAWKSERMADKPVSVEEYRYYHFEEAFRGSRDAIKDKFKQYVRYFKADSGAPVVDLGCGRGEFLELMKEASIPAKGVDSNPGMIEKCREMGLEVTEGDLLQFLIAQPENSLGGIFCSQVIEHVPPEYLMRLLEACHARLKEGAPILLETVNIASTFAFHEIYTKDLTHKTPVHHQTLQFAVTACGFQNAQTIFLTPVPPAEQLRLFPDAAAEDKILFNENMAKLNRLLFGHTEYAVLAFK